MNTNVNYQQNVYSQNGYPIGMYQKKKVDVKGLIITILCLITSLITTFSVLMPIVKTGTRSANIIDVCKMIPDLFDEWELEKFGEVLAFAYTVLAVFAPIIIALVGLIVSIVLIVKLARVKFNGKEVLWVRRILKFELFFSVFATLYYYIVKLYISSKAGMSVGWYLPVIMCVSTLIIAIILEFIFNIVNKKSDGQYVANGILAIVAMIFATIIYISFGFTQVAIDSYSTEKWDFSYELKTFISSLITPKYYWEGDSLSMMIWISISLISIIVITVLASMVINRSIKAIKNGKFGGAASIVAGSFAIVLYLVELIMGEIVVSDIQKSAKVKFGMAGYMYIIFGALLIVVGIVQICVKNCSRNKVANNIPYQNGVQYPSNMPYGNRN